MRLGPVPEDALPDCNGCPKPELGPLNHQAAWVYSKISNQQMFNAFSGHQLGLRFEALNAAIDRYERRGWITDADEVMERVMIIDAVACHEHNSKINAQQEQRKASRRS